MALGYYFQPTGFTRDVYDETVKELERAGLGFGNVPGRTFHCAMEIEGSIAVFDIWQSQEEFEEFGHTLMPIMTKLGADPGEPMVAPIHAMQNG
jgi:hypothetical protein